ncbi:TetR/AcrR family transcriptional regulator [Blastococcus montanus]|uniref:TetR/AcrR family transcriptional regulator n=1 Tax=Blastococcus montanus TaxID=3144973 RepID=UPI00320A4A40
MPTRELRADLIAAATALVERAGSAEAVSLRAVAREAGVTAPAVYGHFADLDALLAAVLDEGFAALRTAVTEAVARRSDPGERLVAGCRAYVETGLAAPGRYRAMFGPRRVAGSRQAFGLLVEGVAACAAAGRSRSRDPEAEATLLWTALHGLVTLRAAAPEGPWPDLDEQLPALVGRLALLTPAGDAGRDQAGPPGPV